MNDPDPNLSPRIADLVAALETLTPLATVRVPIPDTGITFTVMQPAQIDALLDDAANDPEDNLPYWAEVWPSGIALAREVLQHPETLHGIPVLELGSGIGITAAAAIMAGAQLVATDYSPHSLMLTELTCLLAGQPVPVLRQVNWRADDADLLQPNGSTWPLVLAADVLYEERDIEPVLAVLERITAQSGEVWLAEPGRRVARAAIEQARHRGWHIAFRTHDGPWPGSNGVDSQVTLHRMVKSGCND